ncbi:hypothetical protein GOP47_0003214 [Adiantum capillus-veneris]|uniref:Uncharacterized protein n=1 Tax=Adiantum capillus-veneris TaxID=13818 RepID=A0A9D4ZRM1_ADICA|nr:hypothetical protein GOP47_0003214 [Adiantum capillus-veneris]
MEGMACHWDLNELPAFEKQPQWIASSNKMLGRQGPFDMYQIYCTSDKEMDGGDSSDSHKMQDMFEMAQQPCIDDFAFTSNRCFAFDRQAYSLMIASIQKGQGPTIDSLKAVDKRGLLDLRKWERIQTSLHTVTDEDGDMYLVNSIGKRIPCIEDWERIVFPCHTSEHLDWTTTRTAIAETWCTNIRMHGISREFGKEVLDLCSCATVSALEVGHRHTRDVTQCLGLHDRGESDSKSEVCIEQHTESFVDVQKTLDSVVVNHKARLVRLNWVVQTKWKFVCHRWGDARRDDQERW